MVERKPLSLRFDEELLERLDEVAQKLSERAAGATVSRSEVIRMALERGVESLEAELGKGKRRRRK